MAFLVVGGVTVPVAAGSSPTLKYVQIGEVAPAFDGSPRSSVQSERLEVEGIVTPPMLDAAAATLLAVLRGSHPITCSGDLLGSSMSCVPTDIQTAPVHLSPTVRRRAVSFRLLGPAS